MILDQSYQRFALWMQVWVFSYAYLLLTKRIGSWLLTPQLCISLIFWWFIFGWFNVYSNFLQLINSLEVSRHISKCYLIQVLLGVKGSRFKQNQLKLCVPLFLRYLSCFDVLFSVLQVEPFTEWSIWYSFSN